MIAFPPFWIVCRGIVIKSEKFIISLVIHVISGDLMGFWIQACIYGCPRFKAWWGINGLNIFGHNSLSLELLKAMMIRLISWKVVPAASINYDNDQFLVCFGICFTVWSSNGCIHATEKKTNQELEGLHLYEVSFAQKQLSDIYSGQIVDNAFSLDIWILDTSSFSQMSCNEAIGDKNVVVWCAKTFCFPTSLKTDVVIVLKN